MSALLLHLNAAVVQRMGDTRRGATAVEYGLLLALVVAVAMSAITMFGTSTSALFEKLSMIAGLIGF
jgi:Flp pilus assembly pilin Flp